MVIGRFDTRKLARLYTSGIFLSEFKIERVVPEGREDLRGAGLGWEHRVVSDEPHVEGSEKLSHSYGDIFTNGHSF